MVRRAQALLPALVTLVVGASGCARLPATEPLRLEPWRAAAQARDVRILRDEYGVPHVYGRTDADVAFGLAYAHAEDDFETLQKVVLQGRGRLAAVDGRSATPFDYLVHALGFWEDIEARYETDVPPSVRAVAEAYAEGLDLYAVEHPEEVLPGWFPAEEKDVVAGFVFRTPFFYGFQRTLLELLGDERGRALSSPPDDRAHRPFPAAPVEMGSNAVAVAPPRSSDGATRLLVNSHQPYTGPVAWYEARLVSEEGWDMIGGVFPGSPVILHGAGRQLGWASTVNRPDLADVYVLEVHPDDPDLYRYDGAWRRLERSEVVIPVRLFGPFRIGIRREVLRSVHGPVLRTDHGTYAVRYAGMGEIRQLEQYLRMNRATDFDAWWDAMSMQALPSINFVYADREGRIAYVYNARSPIRAPGWDWEAYLPGDRSDLVWTSFHAFDSVPSVVDPASGFVASANHPPYRATLGPENPDPEAFPDWGIETRMTNRGHRLLELYGGDASISADEFRAYKYDKRYSVESDARRIVSEVLELDFAGEPGLERAQAHLATWTFGVEVDDRAAALGVVTATPIVVAELQGLPVPSAESSFREAVAVLLQEHGRIDPAWGEVNRFQRGEIDVPIGGGPDVLRAIESFVLRPDGRYVANSGDCYLLFSEWAEDGTWRVESVHQFGTATLDASSPHYDDQVPLFVSEQTRPARLDLETLEPHVTSVTRPGR